MLVESIARYIDGLGYGTFCPNGYHAENNIFINTLPAEPRDIIAIYDTGGQGSQVGMPHTRRAVQVLVRNQSQKQANLLAWTIHKALVSCSTNGYIFVDDRKMLVSSASTPTFIGKDTNGLFEFSTNFLIWTKDDLNY